MSRSLLFGCAGVVLLLACVVPPVSAFRYTRSTKFEDGYASTYMISEGFMPPAAEGQPASSMSLDGDLTLSSAFPRSGDEFLHVIFVNEFNIESVGYPSPGLGGMSKQTQICCTDALFAQGVCGSGTPAGIIQTPPADGVEPPTVTSIPISSEITPMSASFTVTKAGVQSIVVTMCSASGSITTATLTANWTFKLSSGYLPYRLVAFLGYNTVITICAGVYLLLLGGMLIYHRQHIIVLQGILVITGFVTLIEHATWTTALDQHNTSGVPLSDPTPAVIYAASILTSLKQALSLSLLLAVCLGFGAVVPALPGRVVIAIGVLSGLFFGFSTALQVMQLSVDVPSAGVFLLWFTPVALLNSIFVTWIAGALHVTTRALQAASQHRKLEMYQMLRNAFVACIVFVIAVLLVEMLESFGLFELPAFVEAMGANIWGTTYFVMLVAVTVIWRPGQRTAAFSVYAEAMDSEQMADDMDDDVEDDERSEQSGRDTPEPTVTTGEDAEGHADIELAVIGDGDSEPSETPGRVSRADDAPGGEVRSPLV